MILYRGIFNRWQPDAVGSFGSAEMISGRSPSQKRNVQKQRT
ncbi:MAG: hypothetical protein U5J96_15620 [Ignavibacteriaceae bacterium]|nr:hypothetical protein [Ignavibacteriaceae bacterium]